MTTPEALAEEVNQLASMPDIAFRINDLLDDDNSSAADIGQLIEQDPSLSIVLLKLANSALYNNGAPITAISRAVMTVGAREVRDIAFGVCASNAFEGIPNDLVTMEDFWTHSLYCAAATKAVGDAARIRSQDSLFMAGLLHDIGQLVMYSQRPKDSRQALRLGLERSDGQLTWQAERDVFGFDHMQVGAALARLWRLPDYLQQALLYHHHPHDCPDDDPTVLAVHVGNSLAVLAELDSTSFDDAPPLAPGALDTLGLSAGDALTAVAQAQAGVQELLRLFMH